MPCSVYWPLRHMSHSPTAQRGTRHRVGPADDPDDEVAGRDAGSGRRFEHPTEVLVAEHQPSEPGGASPYSPRTISMSVPQTPTASDSTRIGAVAGRRFG